VSLPAAIDITVREANITVYMQEFTSCTSGSLGLDPAISVCIDDGRSLVLSQAAAQMQPRRIAAAVEVSRSRKLVLSLTAADCC
jgi:hypothetical protein